MSRTAPIGLGCVLAVALLSAHQAPPPGRAAAPTTPQAGAAAVGSCCPDDAAYESAVRAFAAGNRGAAAVAILRAPAKQLTRAVADLKPADQHLLQSAAAMHVVLAASAIDADKLGEASIQMIAGNAVAQKIHRPPSDPQFLATWYAAAAEVYLAGADMDDANGCLEEALKQKLRTGTLLLAKGVLDETAGDADARVAATNVADDDIFETLRRGGAPASKSGFGGFGTFGAHAIGGTARLFFWDRAQGRRFAMDLQNAESDYRQALQMDSASIEAKLRLGRVLAIENKDAEARSTLQAALDASHDARILYLAHLFLADLASRRKDRATAIREYDAATTANPGGATAFIGLSNLELTTGDESRASGPIAAWRAHAATAAVDPWTWYQHGTDERNLTLARLLSMVAH